MYFLQRWGHFFRQEKLNCKLHDINYHTLNAKQKKEVNTMSINMTSIFTWEDYVKKSINDLKDKYPKLNLSQIAMKINLNRSTLTRIINEGIKPQLDNYIKIIIGSGNSTLINEALAAYDISLSDQHDNILKFALKEKDKTYSPQEFEKILEDGDNLIIYVLSLKENGTTINEIYHVLGTKGLETLEYLIDIGLLENNNSIIKQKPRETIIKRSPDSMKKTIKTYAQFYRASHVCKGRNYIHCLTEGMNHQGIKKMLTLHRNFHMNMEKIIRDPENQGEIPMFSVSFCDSLTELSFDSNYQDESSIKGL